MNSRGRISPSQMALMFIISRAIPPAVTLIPTSQAHKDAWLSEFVAPIGAALILGVLLALAVRFPAQSLVGYTESVFGKVAGKVINVVYIWFFLHVAAYNVRQLGDVMSSLIPETPLMVFIASTLFASVVLTRGGIETIARFAEIAFPIAAGSAFLIFVLVLPQATIANLQPVMAGGAMPMLRGALLAVTLFTELLAFAMIYPAINRRAEAPKYMLIYVAVSAVVVGLLAGAAIGIFGSLIADLRFPGYHVARFVNLADFVQRLEGVASAVWLIGFIVKVSLFLYCASLSLAETLHLSDHKPFSLSLGLFVAGLSVAIGDNIFELAEFFRPSVAVPYTLFIMAGLPLLTLAAAAARGFRPQPIPHGDEIV